MRLIALLLCLLTAAPALALSPEESFADPVMETRAQMLFRSIRCVVCEGQVIADSAADVAGDFRRLIRKQMIEGRSDEEIVAFLISRYGEAVHTRPSVSPATYALWYGPLVIVAMAIGIALLYFIRGKKAA